MPEYARPSQKRPSFVADAKTTRQHRVSRGCDVTVGLLLAGPITVSGARVPQPRPTLLPGAGRVGLARGRDTATAACATMADELPSMSSGSWPEMNTNLLPVATTT